MNRTRPADVLVFLVLCPMFASCAASQSPVQATCPACLCECQCAAAQPALIVSSPQTPFGSNQQSAGPLRGAVYHLEAGANGLPDFSSAEPIGVIYTSRFDIPQRRFDEGFPGVTDRFEWFAIRYEGQFSVDREGTYTFRLNSDDGSRLYINGERVIDNDGQHPPRSMSGSIDLQQGNHTIVLEYYQGPRDLIALQLFVTPPGGREQILEVR